VIATEEICVIEIKVEVLQKKKKMNPIARHDSTLVTYSSNDAVAVDAEYGNGRFTCQLNNVNKATHAVKLTPTKVMVPNVFANVEPGSQISVYNQQFDVVGDIVVTENSPFTVIGYYDGYDSNLNFVSSFGYDVMSQDAIFPSGVYTPTEYANTFNSLVALNKKTSINAVNQLNITLSYNPTNNQMTLSVGNMNREMIQETTFLSGTGVVQGFNIGIKVLDSQQTGDGVFRGGNTQFYTTLGMPLTTGTSTLTAVRLVAGGIESSDLVDVQTYVQNFGPVVTLVSGTVTTLTNRGVVETGNYNITLLVSYLNALFDGVLVTTFDVPTSRVTIEFVGAPGGAASGTSIGVSPKLASRLGFANNTHTVVGGELVFPVAVDGTTLFLVANQHPHLGTTPIVYIAAREAAPNNMVASDSNEYNIIATVPMHNASYGQYACYSTPDIFIDDIDFRTARCLSRIDFEVLDYMYQPVVIDPRFAVIIQLKVYHVDTQK
jgi:hypothetical protein